MFLDQLVFWHWWVFGIVLVVLEIFAPGFVFFWLGIAAGVVGLILIPAPDLAWQWQFLVFALISVVSVYAWRLVKRRMPIASDRPTLNRRGEQLVGHRFVLQEAIVNGRGTARVDDTRWKVVGDDMPAGATVRVTGVDGTSLQVERA